MTGRWLNFFTAGMALKSCVFRVYVSKVRMPRSHRMTFSLPPARMYSALISHSSIVADRPRFSRMGFLVCPSSRSKSKFCMLRAPTWITSTSSTKRSISCGAISSVTMGSPVSLRASFNNSSPSYFRP